MRCLWRMVCLVIMCVKDIFLCECVGVKQRMIRQGEIPCKQCLNGLHILLVLVRICKCCDSLPIWFR